MTSAIVVTPLRRRFAWTLLVLFGAFTAGCDTEPASPDAGTLPTTIALSASFPTAASGDDGDAYDAADGVWVRLTSGSEVRFEEVLPFDPAGENRVQIELELDEQETLLLEIEMRRGADPLFRGSTDLTVAPGGTATADLELEAVAAELLVSEPPGPLVSIGETVDLEGAAIFATGDTAVSLTLEWTSLDPQVAEVVTPGGTAQASAVSDGVATIQASAGGFTETVTVTVELQVVSVDVEPASSEIAVGETVQLEAVAVDALGNALTDRAATWSSGDPAVATVDPNGLVRGRTGGTVEISAVVDDVEGIATVDVVATAPDVETTPPLNVGHRRAQLRAVVNPKGAPTTAWFDWGTDPDLSDALSTDPVSLGSAGVEQIFSTTVTGLNPGTRYYVRVVATNDVGTAQGEILAFDTPDPQAPSVETLPATDVGTNSATLQGSVNPNGAATTARFEWADNPSLDGSQTSSVSVGNGSADVAIDADLDDLASERTYYVRVVATNDVGTSQGETLSFRTRIPPPSGLSGGVDPPSVFLDWQDNSTTDTFFRIERSEVSSTSGFEVVGTVLDDSADFDSDFFEDSAPLPVGTVYYRVFACNQAECSGPSNVAEVVIPPPSITARVDYCSDFCFAAGFEVTLTGPVSRTGFTNGSGFVDFPDLPVGTYVVTAREDYCPEFRVDFDEPSQEVTVSSGAEEAFVLFRGNGLMSCTGLTPPPAS